MEAILAALLLFGAMELFLQKETPSTTKFEGSSVIYVASPSFVRTSGNILGSFRAFVLRLNITTPTYLGCLTLSLPLPVKDYTGDGIEDLPDPDTFTVFLDGRPVKFEIITTQLTSSGILTVLIKICPESVVKNGIIEVIFNAI